MDYHHFKISKVNLLFLLLKLTVFLGVIFIFAKLRYEAQQLALMPNQLLDLVFISCCLALGWMYRVNLDDVDLSANDQKIKIKVEYNLYGFVFVRLLSNKGKMASVRLWNPTNYKYALAEGLTAECVFKSDSQLPKGGCRLINS
ncbi:hypothetical protein [Paraglaciecola sp. L1A13]|jgi:hypothetical protein|uniref:hypothetical protein n=1 Tax=Paraglaciecola sp. L1A13 TaxID=2686359 RepID=UPI00131DE155|nr:hypothetical protein [Paraglaciecola sp. L1A13]